VRNPVRREGSSFFLQKADGRFYPDFICKLPDESVLIVEYKGANQWTTDKVKADRAIGELWASLSTTRCQFVMVTERNWAAIDDKLTAQHQTGLGSRTTAQFATEGGVDLDIPRRAEKPRQADFDS